MAAELERIKTGDIKINELSEADWKELEELDEAWVVASRVAPYRCKDESSLLAMGMI